METINQESEPINKEISNEEVHNFISETAGRNFRGSAGLPYYLYKRTLDINSYAYRLSLQGLSETEIQKTILEEFQEQ